MSASTAGPTDGSGPLPEGRTSRAGRVIEWDHAARDYADNRAPFPDVLVDLLAPLGVGAPGQHLVDVGTGVGTPALQFARRGVRVTGVEPAEAMLAEATRRATAEGLPFTPVVGTAEATGLPDAVADAVTAGQAWHWFDHAAAAAEFRRVLRPGGRLAVCSWDWVVGADDLVDATFDVLRRHNPDVVAANPLEAGDHRPHWLAALGAAGLRPVADLLLRTDATYSPTTWRGRLRASTWVRATLDEAAVAAVDADLAAVLADAPPRLAVPHHLVVAVVESPGPPTGGAP